MSTASNPTPTNEQQQEVERPGRGIKPAPGMRVTYGTEIDAGPLYGTIASFTPDGCFIQPDDGGEPQAARWADVYVCIDLDNGLELATPTA